MISFDVTSLFTKVPIEEALQAISTRLTQDDTRTAIPIPDICALTELCLRSTYFTFNSTFFEQVEGGSPLSPIVANLYMEALILRREHWNRQCYALGGTWTTRSSSGPKEKTNYNHLNTQHPSIQFTIEKENGRIPFLDVLKETGLSTKVYRKSTHTDRYINFNSYCYPRVKSGVISCLRNRAEKVCDQEHLGEEMVHLKKTFKVNSYPPMLISRNLSKRNHQQHRITRQSRRS